MADKQYGDWVVGEKIGNGGQGVVYKTIDSAGKEYALKVVKVKANNKKKLLRIKQEVTLIKQLKDAPNVIKIYDDNLKEIDENSQVSQHIWYVMDFAPHGSLTKNDFYFNDVELGLSLFIEILRGVDSAHKAGVIHRDLKPDNLLLYPSQRTVAISDFGLGLLKDDNRKHVTDSDEILGPRHFMSPEQYKDPSNANEKSDIYSLGKVLYYLLTGKGKVFREDIGDLSTEFTGAKQYLPLVQEKLLDKMVAADPKQRFDSVGEIIEVVEEILETVRRTTQRFIRKTGKGFSAYEFLVSGRREEFIDDFSKDLSLSVRLLGRIAEELQVDEKITVLSDLRKDLLSKYPRGKNRAAIEAAFMSAEKPEELKKHENGRYSFAAYFLAKYFERASSHQLAHEHITVAISKEGDPALNLRYLLLLSEICKKCTCSLPHDFEERIAQLLQSTQDDDEKAKLFKILGDHYIDLGNKLQGLRFLEAYLEFKAYDNDVRFDVAHTYYGLDQPALALHHYLIHQKTEQKVNAGVQNNLGVIYSNSDLDLMAMDMYRKSFENGDTLAGSNIASKLVEIGMEDEAEKILRKIISENPGGDYSDQVHVVMGRISTKKDSEKKNLEQLKKQGEQLSYHDRESVKALSNPSHDWPGYWKFDTGTIFEIKKVDNKFVTSRRGSDSKALYLEFDGNTAIVVKITLKDDYDFYTHGVLYLVSGNEFRGFVQKADKSYKEVIGTRIPDITEYEKQQTSTLRSVLESMRP